MILILTADGGSRGNPGPSAYGFAIWKSDLKDLNKEILMQIVVKTEPDFKVGKYIGHATNNQVEWGGLIAGLEYIKENVTDIEKIYIALDSELVVKQITGIYKVKNPGLQPLFLQAKQVLDSFKKTAIPFEFLHIYREFNKIADAQVNQALDNLNQI